MCHEGWLLSTALQHLHSASWTQPVERLDQPIGLEFLDRTVVCLGRLRKAWRSPIPKERRSGNVCSRMVVNAIAYFFYHDGIFELVPELDMRINVLGDNGDK